MKKKLLFLLIGLLLLTPFSPIACKKKTSEPPQPASPAAPSDKLKKAPAVTKTSSLPHLKAGALLMSGKAPLSIGHTAEPEVVDWNNDGKKDLLVGTFEKGMIMLFLNQGSDAEPVFNEGVTLQADGQDIAVPFGWCQGANPRVVDYNHDGKKDLLVGDSEGNIHIFLNTGADDKPVLTDKGLLLLDKEPFKVEARAKIDTADWNNDGKFDVICGDEAGNIHVLINSGSLTEPAFETDLVLPLGNGKLKPLSRPHPRVFDWNGDGKKDLLTADEYSNIRFYENIGADDKPSFADPVLLEAEGQPLKLGYRSRLAICDWNNDKLPDLIYGVTSLKDQKGYLYIYFSQK